MSLTLWIAFGVLYATIIGLVIVERRVWPKRLVVLQDTVQIELELCKQLRLIMQDLESRDPQLVEHMQLGYLQLDDMERDLRQSAVALKALQKMGMM